MLLRLVGIVTTAAVCTVAVSGLARTTNAASPTSGSGVLLEESLHLLVTGDCEYHCRTCDGESLDGEDRHDIVVHAETNRHQSSHLETCNIGSCRSHECGGGGGSESYASASTDHLDPSAMRELSPAQLLLQHPARVELDEQRRVLFLKCSAGQIVASVAVTDADINEFRTATGLH